MIMDCPPVPTQWMVMIWTAASMALGAVLCYFARSHSDADETEDNQ